MTSNRNRWSALALSALASSLLVAWYLNQRTVRAHVEVLDNRQAVEELLAERPARPKPVAPLEIHERVRRFPWRETLVTRIYPQVDLDGFELHEVLGFRRRGGLDQEALFAEYPGGRYRIQTNSLGLRDRELPEERDLLVLFAGDSQTEGVCENDESFVNRLEQGLARRYPGRAIEALNAALGGTGPWYYRDTLEAYLELEPDLFVAVFYGGNDLSGVILLERFYRRRGGGRSLDSFREQNAAGLASLPGATRTSVINQAIYFEVNPEDIEFALSAWCSIALEMRDRCQEAGVRFRPVFLPSPFVGQPGIFQAAREEVALALPDIVDELELEDRLADRWIQVLREEGVEPIDLRPAFQEEDRCLYWQADRHLNLLGQEVVARALEGVLGAEVEQRLLSPIR